jgi:glycerol-3-phosphate dehydrogenase (NAD(P)+)
MIKATVIGNTSWGNTLASLMGNNGVVVNLWARSPDEAKEINKSALSYSSTSNIAEALSESELVLWVVPSQRLRQNISLASQYLEPSMLLISAAKGLEIDTGKRMSQVMAEEVPPALEKQICALSGPNLAKEIAQGLPAAAMIASHNIAIAERVRDLISSPRFLLFPTSDITGVELGGALKNIVALGAGMIDGLGLGDNAKAAFVTWSWEEVISLGTALGARVETFYGLAGLGDFVATCASNLSRNHHVGFELAKGRHLKEITDSMSQVAEGIYTSMAIHKIIPKLNLETPIINCIYQILFENVAASKALVDFGNLTGNVCNPNNTTQGNLA